jgi:hypothetical protein
VVCATRLRKTETRVKFKSRNLKGNDCWGHGNGNFDYVKETREMSLVRLRSPEERPGS